ncbi:MAG: DNA repair protein RadA [Candidatus Levybacteria bacterium RIFOXYA1_FULL_41_10]|nr:MAG: DNA repair protein RadA [Candidatus Levybacteria bacterium GW2011_GWC1_40_19]KKR94436.1 MAG: repair protein radA protein [Candidatus Levybacteria bacterium GW2011_GWA2_41_15]KKS01652.1 MAG: repair protein radA protein [Candidatus Levybacteria bacterium GW2011_GWB1_41_21]OGH25205.1 MAG: DNA repair protein RadA [Candidatus Levybacteria bacterium RIFCSPHIGHO2_02_FULL_40_29]OGH32110.1 MAG: DNA repair protein RadA [Candidatus Levybacteria bacterium RIFCSPHIGHO2_12_FULL_40_44]OGH50956.1 MAG:
MKSQVSFVCQECGYDSPEWMGKCPECGEWNTLREIKHASIAPTKGFSPAQREDLTPKKLSEVKFEVKNRMTTGFSELDGVLGGGIVKGSVILLAGDPGIGKSTLLLQLAMKATGKILYISGEESEEQVKIRAKRLSSTDPKNLYLISLTDTDAALEVIEKVNPTLVIIDSIQTMQSENLTGLSGSVGQVRFATAEFIKAAKTLGIPIIIVGHVTKEGMVAGPMVLSHMVDTLLFLEGEKFTRTRILRSLKNRFGPIDEVGVFLMDERGMVEVKHPEQTFLDSKKADTPGSVLVVTLEGTRAFLVEIQALTVFSKLPMPRRVASGIDSRRLELLLAVLQKHGRVPVDTMDVYVNVAGGLKLSDPAADLGICLAVFSSFKNISLGRSVAVAEVGLLGELRRVSDFEKRAKEAKKLGFKNIIGADKYKTLNEAIQKISK